MISSSNEQSRMKDEGSLEAKSFDGFLELSLYTSNGKREEGRGQLDPLGRHKLEPLLPVHDVSRDIETETDLHLRVGTVGGSVGSGGGEENELERGEGFREEGGDDQLEVGRFPSFFPSSLLTSDRNSASQHPGPEENLNTHRLDSLRLRSLSQLQVQIEINLPLLLDASGRGLRRSQTSHEDLILVGNSRSSRCSTSGRSELPGLGVLEVEDEVGVRRRRGGDGKFGFERPSSDGGDGREARGGGEDRLEGVVT